MKENISHIAANIVIVDDNLDNLRLLANVLTLQGYIVRPVPDSQLALAAIEAEPPDLILLDIMMPPPNGYEVCQQLKANEKTCNIPIIFISAKREVFDKVQAFSLGGVDYITKPFQVQEVLARIENQLSIWRLQKQLSEQNARLSQEIHDRILAENALRESESKYRALVEASQDIIWSIDQQGKYTFVNSAVEQIYGWKPAEMIGHFYDDFLSPDKRDTSRKSFDKILQGATLFQQEISQKNKDGKQIHLLVNAIPLRNAKGKIIGATGTASDISDRKQREEELHLIVEGITSTTGGEFFDSCVRYLAEVLQVRYSILAEFINEEKTKVRTLAFWTGENWSENIEYEIINTPWENLIEGNICYCPDNYQKLSGKNPKLDKLNIRSFLSIPLINSAGNILGYIAILDDKPMALELDKESIIKIFAARASAELERKRVEAELIESEKRLSTIITTNADGIIVIDQQGRVRFINPAAEFLLGRSSTEILGELFEFPLAVGGTIELDIPHATKGLITAEMRVVEIIWDGVNAYLASLRDITDRKQAEKEIRLLLQTNQAINQSENINKALTTILKLICIAIGWDIGEAWIPNNENTYLEYISGWYGSDNSFAKLQNCTEYLQLDINRTLLGQIMSLQQPQWIEDITQVPQDKIFRTKIAVKVGLKSLFGVPIIANEQVVAVLVLLKRQKLRTDNRIIELVQAVAAQLGSLIKHKKSEANLRESERRFRAIFNSTFQFMGLLTTEGILIQSNQSSLDFIGVEEKEIIGLPFWETPWWQISQETRDRVRKAITAAAAGEFIRYEVEIIGIDNTPIIIDFSIKPVFDENGKIVLLIPEGRDISQAKVLQKEITLREARFNAFFTSAPLGMAILDKELRYVQINELLAEINGFPVAEHIGKKSQDILPKFGYNLEFLYQQVIDTGRPLLNLELSGEMPSQPGVYRDWMVSYFPIFGEDNFPTGVGVVVMDITEQQAALRERKKTELALRTVTQRLQHLLASSPVAIYSFKPSNHYQITFMSDNITAVIGYEAREVIEETDFWFNHIYPADIDRILDEYSQLLVKKEHFYEYRFLHKDGNYRWIYDRIRLVTNENGSPLECVGYWEDISDRKYAEESLRQSEATNRALLNAIPDMMFRCLDDGTLVDFKPAKNLENSIDFNIFIGKNIQEVFPYNIGNQLFAAQERAFASGQIQILEYQFPLDQKIYDYEARIVACDQYETITMVRDITDRKQAEYILQETAAREHSLTKIILKMRQTLDFKEIFQITTEELRQTINCDRVVIYRFNSDWSGTFVAESVAQGWKHLIQEQKTSPNLTESTIKWDKCVITNLTNATDVIVDTYLQENQGGVYNQGTSYRCVSDIYTYNFSECYIKLLELFEVRAYIIVPIFCGNKLWGLLASYQNSGPRHWKTSEINMVIQIGNQLGVAFQQAELLSQTQQQSEALQKALIAADSANRAKSEFLASMSHELRTPLNAILGFTQVMSRDKNLNQEQQENLTIINRAGEHLLNLINDILEMSKIEAGRTALNLESFDLINLLNLLEEMLKLQAESKGLQLIFDIASDVPQYIESDPGKLRQVLLNILGNAIKFTQQGSVILRVKTKPNYNYTSFIHKNQQELPTNNTSKKPDKLWFEIEDTGPGIAPTEINLIFEPFTQTNTGLKSHQGTGLGLPISQKYVQLMGGIITVTSQLNRGSNFSFDMGINPLDVENIITNKPQNKIIGLAPNQGEYRILVVDDRQESRLFLVKLLTSIGLIVREAENGQEAVALWSSWQPHLICMDMRMPVMDGYEATKQIRNSRKGSSTIIIALTASAFEKDREKVLSIGCDDFIHKPFREEVLLEKISQHLGLVYTYDQENSITEIINPKIDQNCNDDNLIIYLSQMPEEWTQRLYNAASQGSDDLIIEIVGEMAENNLALANTLTNLANKFEFEKIMYLIQQRN